MKKKLYALFIILLVLSVSVLVMIAPSFATKGISRVELSQELQLPLILNDEKDIKLVFFGYAGCTDVCTPRLYDISVFYSSLNEDTKKRLGVEFLDISIPKDETLPDTFAKFFNKNFKGIYLDKSILREYTKAFSVYFASGLLDKTEFDHSNNLYLIQKNKNKKELRFIYHAYPFDFKQIRKDIEELKNG